MFCSNCGTAVPDGATICPNCKANPTNPAATATATAPPPEGTSAAGTARSASAGAAKVYLDYARDAGLQAWSALKMLAVNPVGALDTAYRTLGDMGALRVGIIFGIVSVICFLLGGYLMLPEFIREDFFDILGFGGFMKLVFFAFTPFLCATACSIGVRKGLGNGGGLGGDCFIVGTALLPMSIWALLSGMLGYEHYNMIAIITVFALCVGILILFTGYTKIDNVSVVASTYLVPAVIVISMWLAGQIGSSIMSDGPGPRSTPSRRSSPPDRSMDEMFKFDLN